jgi:hypothetical protein
VELETFAWLRSPVGQALLAELAGRELREEDSLRELERLRRQFAPEQARAALETALLRRRARAKFPAAERLYFTREALEQASAAPVAAHRAARLAPRGHIADLGCGVGGDALALAAAGATVTGVDRDPLRLAMAAANAEALGLAGRIGWQRRDLLLDDPPAADALFCDPGRRVGGRRRFDPEAYEPPLSRVLGWRAQTPALAAKLAPGVDADALPADAELEFVSLDGELKEAVLWCGPLAQVRRRATLLRHAREGLQHAELTGCRSPVACPLSAPLAFLYEPDPAVIRAGLVTDLAAQIGAAQLDAQIAYLTAERLVATPFARAWPIISWQPFGLKALRRRPCDGEKARLAPRHRRAGAAAQRRRAAPAGGGAHPGGGEAGRPHLWYSRGGGHLTSPRSGPFTAR